ncbi:MAG TPA: PHP domain-containing protein [Gemmatimonadales bacterium]|nr:PHP domain-containing protein [Gemmatimonadales bacterium]
MDFRRAGIPPLTAPASALIDLHLHSSASDGLLPPAAVVRRAAELGLSAIALTDHDTVAGVEEAQAEGAQLGVRVVSGCEFSTSAPWGEIHVLGYFLPPADPTLADFLQRCRDDRVRRGREMVEGLQAWGVDVSFEDLAEETGRAAMGRPHLARALVRLGKVASVDEAFNQWLARGRPAYVEKRLPTFKQVAELVHSVGGIVSAAHLKERGTRATLLAFQEEGLDAVETRHPGHSGEARARLTALAESLGLLRTGGSDWHGDLDGESTHALMGSQEVPAEWLTQLDAYISSS